MLKYSSVTPKHVYLSRRRFLASAPAALGFASGLAFATSKLTAVKSPFSTTENTTLYQDVTSYNDFYEFGTGKNDPVRNARDFRTAPWTTSMEDDVATPQVLDLDALLKLAPLEERIYRHRCVEAWSIVVPWIGFPLRPLVERANPLSSANTLHSRVSTIRNKCLRGGLRAFRFPTLRVSGSTKRCIPSRFSVWVCTERYFPIRTARPSGLLFRGNTDSRASSRSSRFDSLRSSRQPPGRKRTRRNMASILM
jgi:Oxidoreductase molybdopterin binding domain